MTTIRDVAELAGVSVATVSHVLNNTRTVLPQTRQRVLEAAEALCYQPNDVARSLATRATHVVGILVADITNPFSGMVVRRAEELLAARGYSLIVCNTDEQPDREAHYLKWLLAKRVDGVIIAPTGAAQPIFQQYVQRNIPLVFVDRQPPQAYGPVIAIDNVAAGFAATDHLLQLGHRRIGLLTRAPELSTAAGRLAGYRRALAEYGVPLDETLVAFSRYYPGDALDVARQLFAIPQPPTAVVATNHVMTLAALGALQQLGLNCPADVSLVCFDDHPWAPLFTPALTVIRQPIAEMCIRLVEVLMHLIARAKRRPWEEPPPSNNGEVVGNIVLKAELVVRGSCRPLTSMSQPA